MKRILTWILVLAVMLSLCACGKAGADAGKTGALNQADGAGSTATDQTTGVEYPVTVTDQAGRTVTIEKEPQTLVSGYYISTSMLIALDQDHKLVGIEAKANSRPIYRLSAPALLDLPSVGTAKEFDLEGCAALNPDLVILPIKLKSAVESLEQLGIDVILVNPENTDLLVEAIGILAKVTNSEARAQAWLAFNEKQTAMLNEKGVTTSATAPSVYLAGNSSLLSTSGGMMYQHTVIRSAGGSNVAAALTDTYWVNIDYEQLLKWDPAYIILASDAAYTCEDVLKDPNLTNCRAVREGKVYQMPNTAEAWDSPVPSGVLGSVWLASVLHPDLISAEEAQAVITEFYEQFYGFVYPHA